MTSDEEKFLKEVPNNTLVSANEICNKLSLNNCNDIVESLFGQGKIKKDDRNFVIRNMDIERPALEFKNLQSETKNYGWKSLQIKMDVISKIFLIGTTISGIIISLWQYDSSQSKEVFLKQKIQTIDSLKQEILKIKNQYKFSSIPDTLTKSK
jgi:hypothetical protein